MKLKMQQLPLFVLTIALAVSMASLFAVQDASASVDTVCSGYIYTTNCKVTCVPSDPNGCGAAQWSYFCAAKQLIIFQTGQKVGSSLGSSYYCSTGPSCYSTCQ